jgi:hypothetical protein
MKMSHLTGTFDPNSEKCLYEHVFQTVAFRNYDPSWILGRLVTTACLAYFLCFSDCLQMCCDMTSGSRNSGASVDVQLLGNDSVNT